MDFDLLCRFFERFYGHQNQDQFARVIAVTSRLQDHGIFLFLSQNQGVDPRTGNFQNTR